MDAILVEDEKGEVPPFSPMPQIPSETEEGESSVTSIDSRPTTQERSDSPFEAHDDSEDELSVKIETHSKVADSASYNSTPEDSLEMENRVKQEKVSQLGNEEQGSPSNEKSENTKIKPFPYTVYDPQEKPVRFCKVSGDNGILSSFATGEFYLEGHKWRTPAHYFAAQKFSDEKIQASIRNIPSSVMAVRRGRSRKLGPIRSDWEKVKIKLMYRATVAKFIQNENLTQFLKDTQRRLLLFTHDSYWGLGGNNMYGLMLMQIRECLHRNLDPNDFPFDPQCMPTYDGGPSPSEKKSSHAGNLKTAGTALHPKQEGLDVEALALAMVQTNESNSLEKATLLAQSRQDILDEMDQRNENQKPSLSHQSTNENEDVNEDDEDDVNEDDEEDVNEDENEDDEPLAVTLELQDMKIDDQDQKAGEKEDEKESHETPDISFQTENIENQSTVSQEAIQWPSTLLEQIDLAMRLRIQVWILYRGGTIANRYRPIIPQNWIDRPARIQAIDVESDILKTFVFDRIDVVSRVPVQRMPQIPRADVIQKLEELSLSSASNSDASMSIESTDSTLAVAKDAKLSLLKSYFLDSVEQKELDYVSDLIFNGITIHLGLGKLVKGSEALAFVSKSIRRSPGNLKSLTLSTMEQCQSNLLSKAIIASGITQLGLPRMYMNAKSVHAVLETISNAECLQEIVLMDSCKMGKASAQHFEDVVRMRNLHVHTNLPSFHQKSPTKFVARSGRHDIRSASMPVTQIEDVKDAHRQFLFQRANRSNSATKTNFQQRSPFPSQPSSNESLMEQQDASPNSFNGQPRRSSRRRRPVTRNARRQFEEVAEPDEAFSPEFQGSNSSPVYTLQSSSETVPVDNIPSDVEDEDYVEHEDLDLSDQDFEAAERVRYQEVDQVVLSRNQSGRNTRRRNRNPVPTQQATRPVQAGSRKSSESVADAPMSNAEFALSGNWVVVKCIAASKSRGGGRSGVRCRVVYPRSFNLSWNVQGIPYVIREPGKYILCERIEVAKRGGKLSSFYTCILDGAKVHDIGFSFDASDPYRHFSAAAKHGLPRQGDGKSTKGIASPAPSLPLGPKDVAGASTAAGSEQPSKPSLNVSVGATSVMEGLEDVREIDYKELYLESKPIGNGAFGVVYQGFWRGAAVAVKKLRVVEVYKEDKERFMKEFRSEALMMNLLANHPNIIRLVGVCTKAPHFCLVSPLAQHGSMEDLLLGPKGLSLPAKIVWRMARDAASGILHLHCEHVIHRDIALRNMLVGENYHVYVNDFGMSRLKRTESSYSKTTSSLGPVKNMAPEAILEKKYSEASDAYSFGTLLWQIVARAHPYAKVDALQVVVLTSQGKLEPPPLPDYTPSVLAQLITACWDRDPRRRPNFQTIFNTLHMFHARTPVDGLPFHRQSRKKKPAPKTRLFTPPRAFPNDGSAQSTDELKSLGKAPMDSIPRF